MKRLMMVALFCFCALPASAQVTCSPDVDHTTCESVAKWWNLLFPAHPVLQNVSFEIVGPTEFQSRKAAIEKADATLGMRCSGCAPDYPGAPKPQEFENTYNPEVLLFLRDKDSRAYFPTKLLVSTDAFSSIANFKQEKNPDGTITLTSIMDHEFHEDVLQDLTTFITGFYSGMEAALFDQGEAVKQLK